MDAPDQSTRPSPETDTVTDGTDPLKLHWSAVSDVGRVRKDNQDSGYAGPHLLTVCDGVGGAARGDLASSTAVTVLRRLDEPAGGDPVERLAGSLHRAHDRIAELAEADETLNGTSTTATVGLFDGRVLAVGHVGDSRAYLLRDGELTQLTHDHTLVQSLVDEGRITDAEARVHPHRNLILKALDGVRDPDPDLFTVALAAGDRLLFCSDGCCGALDDATLATLLGDGTPDFATVELVRASLEAGSTDNVTCVVADVLGSDAELPDGLTPMLVGAAADLPRGPGSDDTAVRRTIAATDTATSPDTAPSPEAPQQPVDEEDVRYAPRPPRRYEWLRRVLVTVTLAGIAWVVLVGAWSWSQTQFYVSDHDGSVTIFRGLDATLPGGFELSHAYETSDVWVDQLSDYDADLVRSGISASSLSDAQQTVDNLAAQQMGG